MTVSDSAPTQASTEEIIQLLNRPEILSSLKSILEKLPDILTTYERVERSIEFVTETIQDKQSVDYLLDSLKKELPAVSLNSETIKALFLLLDKLPTLVQYVSMIEKLIDFTSSVVSDRDSMHSLIEPIESKLHDYKGIYDEAMERAKLDQSPVSVFSLLKLLKEPLIQNGIHFIRALLKVINEKNGSKI